MVFTIDSSPEGNESHIYIYLCVNIIMYHVTNLGLTIWQFGVVLLDFVPNSLHVSGHMASSLLFPRDPRSHYSNVNVNSFLSLIVTSRYVFLEFNPLAHHILETMLVSYIMLNL